MTLVAVLIPQLLLGAIAVASVGDEQCLLQTNTQIHRHSEEPREPSKVPVFEINLDLAPEKRFSEVSKKYKKQYLELFEKLGNSPGILASAKKVAELRGKESAELMGEIQGIAKDSDVPEFWIQGAQLIPTLQCLKGPMMNFVDEMGVTLPAEDLLSTDPQTPSEVMDHFNIPSFGNAGVLARDKDGSVWHGRSAGYAMPKWVQPFVYDAKFKKDGQELFTAQMMYPLVEPFAAIRRGKNGYSWQVNTRYFDQKEEGMDLMKNLYMEKRTPSGWTHRKILESKDNYEDAVKAFSTTDMPEPAYYIISGVKKGVALARDPDSLVYKMELDDKHPHIVMTNFDYIKNDKKEWLQPTRVKGLSARVRAQNLLDEKKGQVTAQELKDVLNDKDVLSKNVIYQSFINVEHDKYDSILPHCGNCD